MVFYAPTVNAYKRYQDALLGSDPHRLEPRQPHGRLPRRRQRRSLRIECRIPGADVNPYLAYRRRIAAGLDGIERRIEPPERFEGDVYRPRSHAACPVDAPRGDRPFARLEFVREALGREVQSHYAHFFRVEQDAYDRAVTDWERRATSNASRGREHAT
jgi:glutamine synthetase